MIKNPAQIRLIGLGATLYNFGGDSKSDSSTTTRTDTTNNLTSFDKRAVASDQAISLSGDGNAIDRSTSNLTQFFDTSNRSTAFTDNSDRSTNFQDNSDRSVHYTSTDYGSVSGALSLNGAMTTKALDVADHGIAGAVDVLKLQTAEGQKTIAGAFDLAKSSAANAMQNSAQVLGFASSALQQTQAAFAEAKDSGQSKMVTYAIAGAAAVAIAFAMKR